MRRRAAATVIAAFAIVLLVLVGRWVQREKVLPPAPSAPEQRPVEQGTLTVGSATVTIEFADTPAEHARGLSNRDALSPDAGMLFVFATAAPRTFWVKDTRIPLDMLWIRGGRVIGLTENVPPEPGVPEDRLQWYSPPGAVDQVLEVNAGWAAKHGIRAGDQARLRR